MAESGPPGIGDVIFIAFKPIAKMAGIALGGAFFARKGILTPEVCKSNSTLLLNFLLPLLMFSTIVPAFEPENMKTVLALVITAFAYMTFGLIFGFIISAFTPVPRGWSGGVLATGAFCNWGDLPLAFIGTIAKNAPFNGDKDVASGTAYTSIFMVAQMFVVYNLGGIQLVAHDFREREIKDLESAPTTDKALRRSVARVVEKTRRVVGTKSAAADPVSPSCGRCEGKESAAPSTIPSPCESCATSSSPTPASSNPPSVRRTMRQRIHGWIAPFITPASLSLVLGLLVANVRQLKALFVPVLPAVMPNAPDDKPPLDFLMEICSFGGDTVPVIGMVLLGAALSRLSITTLPKGFWKSVGCMALLKLGLGSVIGVLWSGMMVQKTGLVDEGDKMLQFVMIIMAGTPAATSLIYITNSFAPVGRSETELSALSAMLLAQYLLMLLTLTILVVYTLLNVL